MANARSEEAKVGTGFVVTVFLVVNAVGIVFLIGSLIIFKVFVPDAFTVTGTATVDDSSSSSSSSDSSTPSDSKKKDDEGPGVYGPRFESGPAQRASAEPILPADQAPADAPLKAHPDHPWVNLVRAEKEREGQRRFQLSVWDTGERIVVDYMSSADFATHPMMSHANIIVILKNERGEITEWHPPNYLGALEELKDKGTWVLIDRSSEWPGSFMNQEKSPFTPNMEIFVVLEDWYDPNYKKGEPRRTNRKIQPKRFKISNSLSIGNKSAATLAREWKGDEAQSIATSVKTQTGPTPKESREIAEQTLKSEREAWGENLADKAQLTAERPKAIGNEEKLGHPYDFARNASPVLGIAYRFGMPYYGKENYIERLRPVLTDVVVLGYERIMAKPGYAVGGFNVESSDHMSGFQVIFMRIDGQRLNPKDNYTSEWIRAGEVPPKKTETQQSDGKLVIGIHGSDEGIVCNTVGLVLQ